MDKTAVQTLSNHFDGLSHTFNQDNLQGERAITREHVQNNESVRDMLGQRGIKPKQLPP